MRERDLRRVKISPLELQLLTQMPTFLTKLFPPTFTYIGNKISHIRQYEFCAQFIKGKKVLDAACGTGYGSEIIRRNGNRVVGVDINPENIVLARHNFPRNKYYVCNIENLKIFSNEKFDVVVSIQTIEHLWYPKRAINEIHRVLMPNGMFIGSIPANCRHMIPPQAEAPDSYSFKNLKKILIHRFPEISWFYHYLQTNDIRPSTENSLDKVTTHSGDFMFMCKKKLLSARGYGIGYWR